VRASMLLSLGLNEDLAGTVLFDRKTHTNRTGGDLTREILVCCWYHLLLRSHWSYKKVCFGQLSLHCSGWNKEGI
jgi:hypothetical protein